MIMMKNILFYSYSIMPKLVFMTNLTETQSLIHWHEQSQAADALLTSQKTGKPLFIDFFAVNCKGCEKLEATTWRDPRVADLLNEKFVPVMCNGWQQDEDFHRLNGKSMYAFSPVLVTRAADGTELRRTTGYLSAEDMLLELALGRAFDALHCKEWDKAWQILNAAIAEQVMAKNLPEALWWRGVAAYRRSNKNLMAIAEAWAPLVRDYPGTLWADRADILGVYCEC